MSDSTDYANVGCEHVLEGQEGRVLMSHSILDRFFSLETRAQAQLMSRMKLWADGIPLTKEQFNGNEGRCGGGNDRMLVAVKTSVAMKTRLYGFIRHLRGKRTLIVVEIDTAKKQDKANPRVVGRAKSEVLFYDERCGD